MSAVKMAVAGEVARIHIDSPPRNFLSWALNEDLEKALNDAKAQGARVVVIGSDVEGYFIAHGDLRDNVETFSGGTPSGDPLSGIRVARELDRGPMISIAAIDGQAWGGGAELAWACDLRVASEGAVFGQPEVAIGVTPVIGGAAKLARIAGEATALRLVLDGRPIDGTEAYRLGVVHRLVPAGQAFAQAIEWADWLVTLPAKSLSACKHHIKSIRDMPLKDALRQELKTYTELFSDPATLERARQIAERYDAGADSYEAIGLPRP
jgi:enoyl-CoA hydratase/carnithine racemase